jgi:hypothetical protein
MSYSTDKVDAGYIYIRNEIRKDEMSTDKTSVLSKWKTIKMGDIISLR